MKDTVGNGYSGCRRRRGKVRKIERTPDWPGWSGIVRAEGELLIPYRGIQTQGSRLQRLWRLLGKCGSAAVAPPDEPGERNRE